MAGLPAANLSLCRGGERGVPWGLLRKDAAPRRGSVTSRRLCLLTPSPGAQVRTRGSGGHRQTTGGGATGNQAVSQGCAPSVWIRGRDGLPSHLLTRGFDVDCHAEARLSIWWLGGGGLELGTGRLARSRRQCCLCLPGPRAGGRGVSRDLRQQPGFTQALQA